MAATTERILGGRGLDPVCAIGQNFSQTVRLTIEQAPPSFQPQVPTAIPSSTGNTSSGPPKAPEPDLITRYNLHSKISAKGEEKAEESAPTGWAPSKEERQQMLQRRRDEMILAARRRMQEKDEQGGAG